VLRYGYFYGPGTAYDRDGAIVKDIRRGRFPIVGKGGGVFSFIHVHDAAQATMRAVLEDAGGIFNIVDSEPAPVAEWLPYLAKLLHARPPRRVPGFVARFAAGAYGHYMLTRLRGASNVRAREDLKWTPRYPGWRDGFAAALAVTRSGPEVDRL
jgi:nucleoside-diphosphate-sugar epimerase